MTTELGQLKAASEELKTKHETEILRKRTETRDALLKLETFSDSTLIGLTLMHYGYYKPTREELMAVTSQSLLALQKVAGSDAMIAGIAMALETRDSDHASILMDFLFEKMLMEEDVRHKAAPAMKPIQIQCLGDAGKAPLAIVEKHWDAIITKTARVEDRIQLTTQLVADRFEENFKRFRDQAPPLSMFALGRLLTFSPFIEDKEKRQRFIANILVEATPGSELAGQAQKKLVEEIEKEKNSTRIIHIALSSERCIVPNGAYMPPDVEVDKAVAKKWAVLTSGAADAVEQALGIIQAHQSIGPAFNNSATMDAVRATFIDGIRQRPAREKPSESTHAVLSLIAKSSCRQKADAEAILRQYFPSAMDTAMETVTKISEKAKTYLKKKTG